MAMREEGRHWSDEELLWRLYGAEQTDGDAERHLQECGACGERWQELLSQRAELLTAADAAVADDDRLRAQRAAVWQRIERRPSAWALRWAPAGVMAGLIVAALLLLVPVPRPRAPQPRISDQQLFDDAAALSAPEAPEAAAMRGLFEGRTDTEEEVAF